MCLRLGFERGAKRGTGGNARHAPALDDRIDVERGAADEDRQLVPAQNRFAGVQRQVLIASQGHFAVRRQDIDEVMWNPPPLDKVRFGDADVEPPIEVPRIGVDHLTIELRGQCNAESRLADGGRTGNDDDARARFLPLRRVLTWVRLVVARCHGNYYDDIGSAAIRQAGRYAVGRGGSR